MAACRRGTLARIFHLIAGLALLATACTPSGPSAPADPPAPQDPPAHRYEQAIDHARRIIRAYMAETSVPALQIAVGVDGAIVWEESFGTADLESGRPATNDSRFRIASVSKLLTGTLTARLAGKGVLDLDRPIGEYVSGIPEAWRPITARMLVHHTSGIPHYKDREDALDTTFYPTVRAAIGKFRDRPLAHPPGQGETYSSYAYTVLALAIEEAAGKPFLEVMDEEILRPLGMSSTGPDIRSDPPPETTAFYELAEGGEVRMAPEVDLSGRWAGSGYLSTAGDLVRFGLALTKPGHLNRRTLDLIPQRQELPDGSLTDEGFAWGPREDWDGRPMLWGDGSTPGSRCGLLVYPKDGLAMAILTNLRGLALERGELQTLARLFLAARDGVAVESVPELAAGSWEGEMTAGETVLPVRLDLEGAGAEGRSSISFTGWRSFVVADRFRLGDDSWLVPLDGRGLFPLKISRTGRILEVEAPRAGLAFEMGRIGEAGSAPPEVPD